MFGLTTGTSVGEAQVMITSGRGLNAGELTEMAMAKLVFTGPDVAPKVREQAERVRAILYFYLTQAQKSERTTVYNILEQAGEHAAAEIVREL